jgi:hypothetical protein
LTFDQFSRLAIQRWEAVLASRCRWKRKSIGGSAIAFGGRVRLPIQKLIRSRLNRRERCQPKRVAIDASGK